MRTNLALIKSTESVTVTEESVMSGNILDMFSVNGELVT